MKKIYGFTIAEILITLGIIGVIASITIPALISNYKKSTTIGIIKKDISILSQASDLIKLNNGGTLVGAFGTTVSGESVSSYQSNNMTQKYLEQLKGTKYCPYASRANCFGDNSTGNWYDKNRGGDNRGSGNVNGTGAALSLPDGSALMLDLNSENCTYTQIGHFLIPSCGFIFIDANGKKPPNSLGNDIFGVYVTKDGIVPMSDQNLSSSEYCFSGEWSGWGCTAYLLNGQDWE